jgi:hypothetical protein
MDITEEILRQHDEQRRMFAQLDELEPSDGEKLGAMWNRLAVLLAVHAEAEEIYFYPKLLKIGTGEPAGDDGPQDETKDAIKDHNEIRDALRRASAEPPGTDAWWSAVRDAREANSDHMAEEEREDLADFRRHADLETRHRIAVDFLVYEARHYRGIDDEDKGPDRYVQANG